MGDFLLPEVMDKIKPRSIAEVIAIGSPSLALAKKEQGQVKTMAAVLKLLYEVADFYNVGKHLNNLQIEMTAELIIGNYHHLTIADLKLCFRNAYLGKYGQLYDRIDGSIILGWIEQYNESRGATYERLNEIKHKQKIEEKKPLSKTGEKYIRKLKEKFTKKSDVKNTDFSQGMTEAYKHFLKNEQEARERHGKSKLENKEKK